MWQECVVAWSMKCMSWIEESCRGRLEFWISNAAKARLVNNFIFCDEIMES